MALRRWLVTLELALTCALAVTILAGAPARAEGHERDSAAPAPSDQQRRRQAAAELRARGFDVDWRLASWAELHDWTLRAEQARLLRDRYGLQVDWRAYALAEMKDWEGRIARATELRHLGVEADWRLYTAHQLDQLRAFLEQARTAAPQSPRPAQELVPAEVTLGFDPDAIIVPTYVTEELSRDDSDDAILEPNFSRERRRAPRRDDAAAAAPSVGPSPPSAKRPR